MNRSTFWRSCKVFAGTFVLTLCLLLAGIGFLLVDYNTSRISSGGGVSARYETRGARLLQAMDEQMRIVPDEQMDTLSQLWSAIPARWRVGTWLVQGERVLTSAVLDHTEDTVAE